VNPAAGAAPKPPAAVSIWTAFRFWLKLGCISFGGPAGQIAIMHAELVERRRWISERRFLHALNYCMVLPGPEAQQLATYIGWLMHRSWGGIIAGGLFVLPSLFVLIALSWIYLRFGDVPVIAGIFYGIKPAVTALVVHAAFRLGSRALRNRVMAAMALVSFLAIFVFAVPFPLIVIGAGVIGIAGARWAPAWFAPPAAAGHGAAGKAGGKDKDGAGLGPALIDDDTPTPPHARASRAQMLRVLTIGIVLWGLAFGALVAWAGLHGTLTQMATFFSKAALITFGGAYAVLPYVYQAAVEQFQWVTGTQMIDGLALGESTPGPLIMVVAFVGFVGGWTHAALGPDAVFLGGAVAATVVTFFTFLPSFIFILAGGPLIEATHGRLAFTAPLSAISAAVVGVIATLACFFAYHVFWPRGLAGPVDAVALVIALLAAIALFRFKVGVVPLLGVCGALGVAATWALPGLR
jgi:chromate transporter